MSGLDAPRSLCYHAVMEPRPKIETVFETLLADGSRLLKDAGWNGNRFATNPDKGAFFRLRVQALNLVRRVCGEESDHYRELLKLPGGDKHPVNIGSFPPVVSVLVAAYSDYKAGLLFDLRSIISAEILGDFMEQAETLLKAGYVAPAASLAGAVLEDAMRRLCEKHGQAVPEKTAIGKLNDILRKAEVYNLLVHKRITALGDIRNNADHGHFNDFSAADVEDMIQYLKRFTADYLQ